MEAESLRAARSDLGERRVKEAKDGIVNFLMGDLEAVASGIVDASESGPSRLKEVHSYLASEGMERELLDRATQELLKEGLVAKFGQGTSTTIQLTQKGKVRGWKLGEVYRNPARRKAAKKKAKKAAEKAATSPAKNLINKCRKLWDYYCERPSKKRLKEVLEHLEKMKEKSTAKSVREERSRCLRSANREAKKLGL